MNENGEQCSPIFPVQDSTLSSEAIVDRVLKAYNLPKGTTCRFFRKGICDTYKVHAGDDEYYLKVYRADRRTRTDVVEEVRLLNYLAEQGLSVARPVIRQDGQYVNQMAAPEGTRYSVLFEGARGVKGDDAKHAQSTAYGAMVARIHQCADRMREPYMRDHLDMRHLVDDNLTAIEHLVRHRETDFTLILRIAEGCKRQVAELLPKAQPEYGICIGDLHGGDVRYDEGNKPTLFDLDSSGCGWRALDMGVYLASHSWMDITSDAERKRQCRMRAFLEGYSSRRQPNDNELRVVQLGPPVRHIYLMGIVLRYTAKYEGVSWADDHFIDWHMIWFKHWAEKNLQQW